MEKKVERKKKIDRYIKMVRQYEPFDSKYLPPNSGLGLCSQTCPKELANNLKDYYWNYVYSTKDNKVIRDLLYLPKEGFTKKMFNDYVANYTKMMTVC